MIVIISFSYFTASSKVITPPPCALGLYTNRVKATRRLFCAQVYIDRNYKQARYFT